MCNSVVHTGMLPASLQKKDASAKRHEIERILINRFSTLYISQYK